MDTPKEKDIIVTGGAGFIGSHLVDSLVEDNHVTIIDNLSSGREDYVNDDAVFELVDITEYDAFRDALGEPDLIFHLAASAHTRKTSAGWNDPNFDADVNALGTLNLLQAVQELDIDPRIVYASSAAVYGNPEYAPMDESHPTNPISPYGVHKLTSEKYMNAYHTEHGFDVHGVRIFNTFGPRQPRYVMYDFLKKLQQNNDELEVLGTGEQVRDYCYVQDTVNAFNLIAQKGDAGEVYNLSGNNVISIDDLAELMIELTGLDASVTYTEESWTGDLDKLAADTTKLETIGYEPQTGLDEGLRKFIEYFKETEGEIKE